VNIFAMDNNEFLKPLLDMMNKRMDGLESKIDTNTSTTNQVLAQAQETNGRMLSAEDAIKRLEIVKGSRPFTFSPNLIYMIAAGFVLLLAIIAVMLHINIGSLLK
jgi:hypothetical protein